MSHAPDKESCAETSKEFATGKTENRSPNSINMHRDDRRLDSFHDFVPARAGRAASVRSASSCPSGKMQSSSPFFKLRSRRVENESVPAVLDSTQSESTPIIFANGFTSQCSYEPLNIKNRIGRSVVAISNTPSTIDPGFGHSIAPPRAGTFSAPFV